MTRLLRAWLAVALILALADYGGAGDLVRPLLAGAVALTLAGIAATLRADLRPPPLGWIALLFLPLIALTAAQILPLGWPHPWLRDDLALLAVHQTAWSIEPAASSEALAWLLTLAGVALATCVLARGERVRGLVDALLYVAATCAVLGLCLALTAAPWPSGDQVTRARGPFIYPNHAAAFWAACLPLAVLVAHRRGGAMGWGTVAVLALAILLSGSRGGILVTTVVMLPLALWLLPRRRRWWWAGAGSVLVAGWLWLIGLHEVADKFGRLAGDEGLTLNGRLDIWRAALPVIGDAGPFGSGAGTTTSAFRRSGDTHFADALVNHLHSDPLEWCLEYGWLGLLVAIAALGTALLRLRPAAGVWADPAQRTLVLGAATGLLILGLHGCGDFIWHSPAVALTGVLLWCILALGGHRHATSPGAGGRIRAACLGLALLLAVAVLPSWRWHQADDLARDVERLAVARSRDHLPLGEAAVLAEAQQAAPACVRLAVTQAWLARAAGDTAAAGAALAAAAELAPGDAAAWAERAQLAAAGADPAAMATAIRRALAWAPAWPDLQRIALRLVAGQRQALPVEQTRAILAAVLASDRAQPPWFFLLAEEVLGAQELADRLRPAGPALRRASEDWLATAGPLADWLAVRAASAQPPPRLPLALALANDRLLGAGGWQPELPLEAEDRRALADQLASAGLPLPAALGEELVRDGPPWSRWAAPIDLLDEATRSGLKTVLRSELHRGWARSWSDRISLTTRALAGEPAVVTRDSDPPLLACVAGSDPQHAAPAAIGEALRQRAQALLARWREWEWQALPQAGQWSWWYGDGSGSALLRTARWAGLVIDGRWIGWVRGQQDLAPLMDAGLHRVVLLTP